MLINDDVIVAGFFRVPGATLHRGIVKLHGDGTVDESFNALLGNGGVETMMALPDGKVLIAGSFVSVNGQAITNIARLNADGSLDTNFWPAPIRSVFGSGSVSSFYLEPDGRIIIGGEFRYVNDVFQHGLARLNADGSRDALFAAGYFHNTPDPPYGSYTALINHVARQLDGKILVSGRFAGANGIDRTNIIRFETNGTVDATFLAGAPDENAHLVSGTIVLPNGQILVYGWFDSIAGQPASSVVRLNSDGSRDSTFEFGWLGSHYGGVGSVRSLMHDTAGRLLIGGNFDFINGVPRRNVARFVTNSSPGSIQFVATNIIVGEDLSTAATLTVTRIDGRSGNVALDFLPSAGTAMPDIDYSALTGTVAYADGEFAPKSFTVPIIDDLFTETAEFFGVTLANPTNGLMLGNPSVARVTISPNDSLGSVDATFHTSLDAYWVHVIIAQPDGKILAGGVYGTRTFRIVHRELRG